jgi:poly(3-hydroxybutyrate) depolymerase
MSFGLLLLAAWYQSGARAAPDSGAPDSTPRSAHAPTERRSAIRAVAPARASALCSNKAPATGGAFSSRTLRVAELERTYHLRLPDGYRPTRAYPVIFRFHGRGGDGLSGGLGIEAYSARDALVVAPDGLDRNWSYLNEQADLALFDALLASLTDTYCVDAARVYAYGFSAGARFAELLACRRSSKLRAIAAIAGFDETPLARCEGPVAAWLAHDADDDSYATLARGIVARDRLREQNGCSTASAPEQSCVRYQRCRAGYPVVWCQTKGRGHDIRGEDAPPRVWRFFSRLPRASPRR